MAEPGGSVADIISQALKNDKVPDQVASLVISAMRTTDDESEIPEPEPKRAYLKAITVEGFRGIGPKITLTLQPGPGLTVVTGRNGSGKSSFAEAAELALTGENKRWSDRTAVWEEGWRNLHDPDTTAIVVQLTEDGEPGTATVTREWAAAAALDDAHASVETAGVTQPPAAKGWARPLELYRPFLSYSELGALVSGQPSKMHDALQAILGLDLLIDTERTLGDSRRSAESESKLARQELPALLEKLANHPTSGPAPPRRRSAAGPGTSRRWTRWPLAAAPSLTAARACCSRSPRSRSLPPMTSRPPSPGWPQHGRRWRRSPGRGPTTHGDLPACCPRRSSISARTQASHARYAAGACSTTRGRSRPRTRSQS